MGDSARGYSWQPFDPGNEAAVTHGARSDRKVRPLAERYEARLIEVAPWTAQPAFERLRSRWADTQARIDLLRAYLEEHGDLTEAGGVRSAAEYLLKLERNDDRLIGELGLSPAALMKLLAAGGTVAAQAVTADGREALLALGAQFVAAAERRHALEAASAAGSPAQVAQVPLNAASASDTSANPSPTEGDSQGD